MPEIGVQDALAQLIAAIGRELAPQVQPKLVYPFRVQQRVVSQVFGANPQAYARFGMAGHNGIDFAVPVGTEVLAPTGGQCWVYTDTDYGNAVEIWYPRIGQDALYKVILAHGERPLIQQGRNVGAGEVVMLSGNTGNSTGPHLHLGFKPLKNGAVNPAYRGWTDPRFYLEV